MKPDRPDLAPWQERLLRLNLRQTRALILGAGICIWMGLFPPWEKQFMGPMGNPYVQQAGFDFILSPPDVYQNEYYMGSTVNWTRLFILWAITGALTLLYVWRFRDHLHDEPPTRIRMDPYR